MPIPYTLIRSRRKSLSIQIDSGWNLIARAPIKMDISSIENFILKKMEWIEKHQKRMENIPKKSILSETDIKIQKKNLENHIVPRIYELWQWKNLPPITSIKITKSERRWGSCSSKNWLCFSYRLHEFLGSPFIDAIILHELAHFTHKNHQKPFWDLVYSWMPEYEWIIRNRYYTKTDQ